MRRRKLPPPYRSGKLNCSSRLRSRRRLQAPEQSLGQEVWTLEQHTHVGVKELFGRVLEKRDLQEARVVNEIVEGRGLPFAIHYCHHLFPEGDERGAPADVEAQGNRLGAPLP